MTTSMITTTVFCTTTFEGFHRWAQCPFDDVSFLRDRHRHIFHVKASRAVGHDDRDTEFIILKREVAAYISSTWPDGELGNMSCEMIGRVLIDNLNLSAVEVSEDGENGAVLIKT